VAIFTIGATFVNEDGETVVVVQADRANERVSLPVELHGDVSVDLVALLRCLLEESRRTNAYLAIINGERIE